jgi:phage replication O-like protein O
VVSKLLIPNTTQVPNVLLDVVMPAIKNASLRVLLAVARKTYGYQKSADDISLTQLQKLTGLSRQGVVNGISGLGNLLGIENGDDGMNRYRLNVDLSSGELVNLFDQSKKLTSQKRSPQGSQRSRHTKPNKNKTNICGPSPVPNPETRRDDAAIDDGFERAWSLYPRRSGSNSKKAAYGKWQAQLRKGVKSEDMQAAVERYANYIRGTGKEGTELVMQAQRFFGPNEEWKNDWALPSENGRGPNSGGFVA